MLVLGHTGIALGAALLADAALSRHAGYRSRREHFDLRLLFIGSLLPDLIDKPAALLFPGSLGAGRTLAHTLLFLLITLAASVCLWRRGSTWLAVLAFGTLLHLLLDEMWLYYRTMLWPVYGWGFPGPAADGWVRLWGLLTGLGGYLRPGEIAGAVILVYFAAMLFRHHVWRRFFGSGGVLGYSPQRP
ncbi:MAG: metal-dependent hydrolase [Chloroflexota bacterium]